jgi:methionine-rich copper-binding protein CopC
VCAVAPRTAHAHAVLLSSNPVKNGSVAGSDSTITLKYNSRVDGARSALSLVKPDQSIEHLSGLTQSAPGELSAPTKGLVKGSYLLRWQVLAADGHITRGQYAFSVK